MFTLICREVEMAYLPYPNKQINIPYLLKIGEGKLAKVGKYLVDKGLVNVALFWGEGLEDVFGQTLNQSLREYGIKTAYKQDVRYINIEEITKIAFNLPANLEAIVGIGGGRALDFAKYTAHLLKLPFISIPTSTSNDGFCSPNCSLLVDGRRKSVKSSIPFGVVIDLDVIRSCPLICFYSGLGDMISKVTALWDWKKAFQKGYERYNDFASLMAYNSLDLLFIKHSFDVKAPEFQRSLTNSLLISGIAMEIAGTSRPASGSEHLISHALDQVCRRPQMHGLQVGVATYLCALLQNNPTVESVREVLLNTGFFAYVRQNPFDKDEFVTALRLAPSIKKDYYTILSEPDSFDRALQLIKSDSILTTLIKKNLG